MFTLFHRAFKICSKFEIFHQEIGKLKTIFQDNCFVDFRIKKYLDKVFIKKEVVLKVSKRNSFASFLLLEKSLQLRTRLVNSVENNLKFCKLKIFFQSPCKLNSLFRYKVSFKKNIRPDIVYRYTCSNCKVTY